MRDRRRPPTRARLFWIARGPGAAFSLRFCVGDGLVEDRRAYCRNVPSGWAEHRFARDRPAILWRHGTTTHLGRQRQRALNHRRERSPIRPPGSGRFSGRRDGYIASILRRYRDLAEQFRAMSGVLASSRDQNSGALSESGLTRIQSAISQSDDDLRQLNELNARAMQVEKKLAKP